MRLLDLAKDKTILDILEKVFGILCTHAGTEKRALEMYLRDIEQSNSTPEFKVFKMLNAKPTFKKLKKQGRDIKKG